MLVEDIKRYPAARIQREVGVDEFMAEDVLAEVARRASLSPANYPFRQEGRAVKSEGQPSRTYVLPLLLSASREYRTRAEWDEANERFDTQVADAIAAYLGADSFGLRFSTPAAGPREEDFATLVRNLANRLGLRPGTGPWRFARRDGGVDAVAWRRFADRRTGFVVILAQCTVRFEREAKVRDIVVDQWRAWIDLAKDPLTVLAVPFVLSASYEDERWDEHRRAVHFVLDRMRICELLGDRELTDATAADAWIEREIGRNRA